MSEPDPQLCQNLFAPCPQHEARTRLRARMLQRGGVPFLLLPENPRLAATALALYTPQTRRARLAKAALILALRCNLPLGTAMSLSIARDDSFADYLSQVASAPLSHTTSGQLPAPTFPEIALLAGNPRVSGRRCVILVFDRACNPAGVVKAGAEDAARRLIAREEQFLRTVSPGTPGVPPLRSVFESNRVRALATDFISGDSPSPDDWEGVGKVLSSWLKAGASVTIGSTALWRTLIECAGSRLPAAVTNVSSAQVHPAVFHGDFAPWNIKVNRGTWTLIDWERGDLAGIPGWDWFHFVIQHALLVKRTSTPGLLARAESFFTSAPFQRYAQESGIAGHERVLALAYLYYCIHVLRPSEGLPELQIFAETVSRVWLGKRYGKR